MPEWCNSIPPYHIYPPKLVQGIIVGFSVSNPASPSQPQLPRAHRKAMQLWRKPRNESQSPSLKRIHEGQHIQKSSVLQVPATIPSHDLGKTSEKKKCHDLWTISTCHPHEIIDLPKKINSFPWSESLALLTLTATSAAETSSVVSRENLASVGVVQVDFSGNSPAICNLALAKILSARLSP